MKKKVLFLFVILQSLFMIQAAAAEPFTDLKGVPWAKESIYFLHDRGSIAGTSKTAFSPNTNISRAQAVAILVRELYGEQKPMHPPQFKDVTKKHYFYKEISIATEQGLIAGFPDGTFRPDANLTRAETVSILERAYGIKKGTSAYSFRDLDKAKWALPSIDALASNQLIGGYEDKTFRPNNKVTRAEFAVFLTRVIRFDPKTVEATVSSFEKKDGGELFVSLNGGKERLSLAGVKSNAGSSVLLDKLVGKKVLVEPEAAAGENAAYLWYGGELVNEELIRHGCAEFDGASSMKYAGKLEAAAARGGNCSGKGLSVEALLKKMTLEEKVGQLLLPMLYNSNGVSSTIINDKTIQMIKKNHVGGVILFEKDMVSAEQITKLTNEMQKESGKIPLLIGTDQEGGSVKRIPGGANMPGNMALGATKKPALAYDAGKAMGEELDSLGINVNFAPSLDINVNPDNPIIGIRSFSEDPQVVSDFGAELIRGLQAADVMASAKHFPGHGDTVIDTHLGLPELPYGLERLEAVELKPFRKAIDQGVDMVMTAHITFPAIDPATVRSKKDGTQIHLPATLSKKVLTGLLREKMGFNGVFVTDAFTMKAITDNFGEQEAAILALQAGADIILMPQEVDKTAAAILAAVDNGQLTKERIDESVSRILQLKLKYGLFDRRDWLKNELETMKQTVGNEDHRRIEQTIAEQAVTVTKGGNAKSIKGAKQIAVTAPLPEQISLLAAEAKKAFPGATVKTYSYPELQHSKNMAASDYLILGSYFHRNKVAATKLGELQNLVNAANAGGKGYAVLSMGDPYELRSLKNVQMYMAVYGDNEPNVTAGIERLKTE